MQQHHTRYTIPDLSTCDQEQAFLYIKGFYMPLTICVNAKYSKTQPKYLKYNVLSFGQLIK
jgi:hypothetical protein